MFVKCYKAVGHKRNEFEEIRRWTFDTLVNVWSGSHGVKGMLCLSPSLFSHTALLKIYSTWKNANHVLSIFTSSLSLFLRVILFFRTCVLMLLILLWSTSDETSNSLAIRNRAYFRFSSSELWHRTNLYTDTNFSEEQVASIFRATSCSHDEGCKLLDGKWYLHLQDRGGPEDESSVLPRNVYIRLQCYTYASTDQKTEHSPPWKTENTFLSSYW